MRSLLRKSNLQAEQCLYIGDRFDEFKAAQEAAILLPWRNGALRETSLFFLLISFAANPDAGVLMNHLYRKML